MAPPDTAPVPTSQQVVQYLQNLSALANRPEGNGQLTGYLGQAGLSTRPVTLNPTDWHGLGAGTTKQKAGALNPSGDKVSDIHTASQGIKDAADTVEKLFESFDKAITAATADKWHGTAAQAAADAISGYVRDSYAMVEAGYAAAAQFGSLYSSMAATYRNLPDRPRASTLANVVQFWHWTDTTTAQSRADTAANGEAERVMNSIYYGNDPGQNVSGAGITAVAGSLPIFPAPTSPVVSSRTGSPSGPSYSSAGGGTTGAGLSGSSGPADGPSSSHGTGTNTGANPDGAGSHVGGSQQPGSGLGSNAGARHGDTTDPVSDGGNDTRAASADPGAGSGGGAGGDFGGGGGDDGSDPSLASPSLDGNPAAGTRATGGPAAVAGAAGRSGMPGMGMPGARGGKNEDKEHKTADYLRGNHLQEIFDTVDGRRVGPPVLGVWNEDAGESSETDDA